MEIIFDREAARRLHLDQAIDQLNGLVDFACADRDFFLSQLLEMARIESLRLLREAEEASSTLAN